MKKQLLLAEVRHILLSNVDSRDNDNLLISLVWRKRVSDTPDTKDFLRKLSLGIYPSGETITRLRRKIQEETPELRGKKYMERQRNQEVVKKDLGYSK